MTVLVGVLAAVAASAITLLVVQALARGNAGLAGRTVEVHTRDDQSLRGVLHAEHADRYTLRETVYLQAGGDEVVRGTVHVPRDNVAWMREPQ